MTGGHPYQYVVLRCVPRVDREEFVNVGVVLYCQATDFLQAVWNLERRALAGARPARRRRRRLRRAGLHRPASAPATRKAGAAGQQPLGTRFGFVRAPRSTVLQPGPVHGGVTDDPARQLEHLLERLVG